MGLASALEQAGAARTRAAGWTPHGGWLRFPPAAPAGYGISRRRLDPLVRALAVETPGVEYFPGERVTGLLADGDRPAGVETECRDRERRSLRAKLTVAADGRDSPLARLARIPARVRPNNRFAYWAYWHGVRTPPDEARVWLLDPDAAAVFPNEDGRTVIAVVAHNDRLPEFRADPDAAYLRFIRRLPDGPDLAAAERASELIGSLRISNRMRPAARPGMALVGDAALATDPLFGVGCGWAFQSAEWLVEETATALLDPHGNLDHALGRYRRAFLRRLGPHHLQIADYSSGRPMRRNERLILRAAARYPAVGAPVERFVTRRSPAPGRRAP
jgi:flavin-dependent dehydrogenase